MNKSSLEQNLKQSSSCGQLEQYQDQASIHNPVDRIFKDSDKFEFSSKIKDYSVKTWTPLINKLCFSKQLKLKFVGITKVDIYLNKDDEVSYTYTYRAFGSSLCIKDEGQNIEVAKIENDLIYLIREDGKYEKIGQILNQVQCKKIKVIVWGQMPNSVFQTGSNKHINCQVIPCCYPFYKLYRYFQKDEVAVKDKNSDTIYSTYSTKSLKKQKQSIFTFSENLKQNIDKLLSFIIAMQYIEIIWYNRYSQYFQK
ncbi:hypothetical protein ABPG72_020659 [Tetrahymena utriculariae]